MAITIAIDVSPEPGARRDPAVYVLGWTIAGLPLEGQKELLGRYRMADGDTRSWVRETLERHLAERHPA